MAAQLSRGPREGGEREKAERDKDEDNVVQHGSLR
jgi:hypothetical protein